MKSNKEIIEYLKNRKIEFETIIKTGEYYPPRQELILEKIEDFEKLINWIEE